MVKVVISHHSYPHDAGHSQVSTPIKQHKIDNQYQPSMVHCKKNMHCQKRSVMSVKPELVG